MENIFKVMERLNTLCLKSKPDEEHFNKFGGYLKAGDYPAAAKHIKEYMHKDGAKSQYQQSLSSLLPHFQASSPAEAENRLFKLLLAIKLRNIAHIEVEKELTTGGALVVNDMFLGDPFPPVIIGDTPLMAAIAEGDAYVIKLLLQYGAVIDPLTNINEVLNFHGETALHIACRLNIPELVTMILAAKADPHITTANRETALQIADRVGAKEIHAELLRRGADPTISASPEEMTKLFMQAYQNKDIAAMHGMIEKGYKVSKQFLKEAKANQPDVYAALKMPFKTRKRNIVTSGGMNLFPDKEDELSPLFRVIFTENKDLDPLIKRRIDMIYNYNNSILKPLLDIAILAAKAGHERGKTTGKTLKIIMTADHHVAGVRINANEKTRGRYALKSSVYAAGFVGEEDAVYFSVSTMLHELKHFADKQIYGSSNKPFSGLEYEMQSFNKVKEKLRKSSSDFFNNYTDKTVTIDAFIYDSIESIFKVYTSDHQDAEVMVKVPEIIGLLGMEKGLEWLNKNEPELLQHYIRYFNSDAEMYLQSQASANLAANSPVMKK